MLDNNYINIQYWMVSKLNLKGNELLLYAIIYGFSQDGNSVFSGSSSYLESWLNTSKQTVFNTLKSLVEKGLIIKMDKIVNGVKLCDYKINFDMLNCENHPQKKEEQPIKRNRFEKPSVEEVSDEMYAQMFKKKKNMSAKECDEEATKFYNYYESCGWLVGNKPMKSWIAAVSNWLIHYEKYKKK